MVAVSQLTSAQAASSWLTSYKTPTITYPGPSKPSFRGRIGSGCCRSLPGSTPTQLATNSLMIAAQFPTASHIGGYQFWRTLGRQVRAGEHGIRILAPVTRRTTTTDDTTEPASDTTPTTDTTTTARTVRGFRLVSVFDISQTDGPDLPKVAPVLLDGDAPADGWAQIERLIVTSCGRRSGLSASVAHGGSGGCRGG